MRSIHKPSVQLQQHGVDRSDTGCRVRRATESSVPARVRNRNHSGRHGRRNARTRRQSILRGSSSTQRAVYLGRSAVHFRRNPASGAPQRTKCLLVDERGRQGPYGHGRRRGQDRQQWRNPPELSCHQPLSKCCSSRSIRGPVESPSLLSYARYPFVWRPSSFGRRPFKRVRRIQIFCVLPMTPSFKVFLFKEIH